MYAERHEHWRTTNDSGHWRQRAHAHTISPTPEPERGIEDATRAIKLDPEHPMGYGHRAIAYTHLPTPEWEKASPASNGKSNASMATTQRRTDYGRGSTKTSATTRQPNGTADWPADGAAVFTATTR